MWRFALLAVVGACGFSITTSGAPSDDQPPADGGADMTIDVDPAHWLPGYPYRRPLTVATGQASTLDNFVVGIVLASDPSLAANARDDGQDLIVTLADDTILEYELERFDGTTGALALWARVPALTPQTSLYLYYGGDIRLHDSRATWDPQTFRAVWHLSDANPMMARDSAGLHDLALSYGTTTPGQQDGIAALSRGLDGNNDMLRDDADDDTLDFGMGSFSYSVWVNIATSAGSFDMPMFKGGASAGQPGYDVELGTSNWTMYVGDSNDNRPVTVRNETANQWINITGVVDRPNGLLRGFTDGMEIMKADIADLGSLSSSYTLTLGSNGSNYWFRGRLDEPRIYARALSAEWVAAEFANLKSPTTFVVMGAQETMP